MAGKKTADWSLGPGKSPAMGALNAGCTVVTLTAGAFESHAVSPWLGVAGGGLAAAGSLVALVWDDHFRFIEGRAMCYRAACWLGAGVWSTVQMSMRPWSWTSVAVLGGMTVAAAAIGTGLRHGENRRHAEAEQKIQQAEKVKAQAKAEQEARAEAARLTEQERIAAYWQPRFRKICKLPGLEIEGVEIWPTGDGYTLGGLVPDDGTTADTAVKPHEKSLATSADLKQGCNVEILVNIAGESRRVFHARINTFNAMAEDQPYPADYSNRSIVDPISLGVGSDRSIGGVSLLDDSLVLIGQTGSGKSTTLNVATAEVARCTDALAFAIDKKGLGEYPRRWDTAWYEGRAERPAIHLVAVNDEQAELMTLGIINIVMGRPVAYAKDMLARGERKIMPTPQLPQIILIVDEFKSLTDSVKANIELIKDQGRSAAVEVIVCALEATGAAIPRTLIKQCRERIGLRFNDEAELQHLFDATWKSGRFDPASMTHPGMMLLSTGAKPPLQHKSYDMTPAQIDEISIVVGTQRPPLDDLSIAMFNTVIRRVRDAKDNWVMETVTDVYTTWWDKTKPLMFGDGVEDVQEMANVSSAPAAAPASGEDVFYNLASSGDSLQRSLDALRADAAAAEAAREEREPEAPTEKVDPDKMPAATPDPEFDAIVGAGLIAARERYKHLLMRLGPCGATEISSRLRLEGYKTNRQTVQDWFDKDATAGLVRREDDGWRWIGGQS